MGASSRDRESTSLKQLRIIAADDTCSFLTVFSEWRGLISPQRCEDGPEQIGAKLPAGERRSPLEWRCLSAQLPRNERGPAALGWEINFFSWEPPAMTLRYCNSRRTNVWDRRGSSCLHFLLEQSPRNRGI